jgi:hypothetical protein
MQDRGVSLGYTTQALRVGRNRSGGPRRLTVAASPPQPLEPRGIGRRFSSSSSRAAIRPPGALRIGRHQAASRGRSGNFHQVGSCRRRKYNLHDRSERSAVSRAMRAILARSSAKTCSAGMPGRWSCSRRWYEAGRAHCSSGLIAKPGR